jgi:serine phosphatase RsbU (regulator of sigma subunit)
LGEDGLSGLLFELLRFRNKHPGELKSPDKLAYVEAVSIPHTVEPSDLRQLIGHRECVQASDTLEEVHKRFAGHEYEFMLVMEGEGFVGLCERQRIGMVLGARFAFAMHSRQPVREAMLPQTTIVKVNQPLAEVLAITCSRPNASLYDDVVLMDEAGTVLGLIFSRTLVRLQNGLLQEKIQQLEHKQGELNKKHEEMAGDLQLAREIQLAMLPAQLPVIAADRMSLQFCHRYESISAVSGDFFHILKISENSVGVFVCDVMGHGVRSAFVTVMLRALMEEMRALADQPGELLTRINAELMCILKPGNGPLYATAFYLVADIARQQIRFARAGHPNPLVMQRFTGQFRTLKCVAGTQGPALGMFNDARYGSNECPLERGDIILLFTDGLYEVFDATEKEFGLNGLTSVLQRQKNQPLNAMLDGLLTEARGHSATDRFDDDVCLVALEAA